MAAIALATAACNKQAASTNDAEKAPITKQTITMQGDRLTPEALWAMGRIGSVQVQNNTLAYTVTYYSVEENRSTTWVKVAINADNSDTITELDEFVGSDPAWIAPDQLAYIKDGKIHLKTYAKEGVKETCLSSEHDGDIEGFLFSPDASNVLIIKQVKTIESTVDQYPDLPLASGRIVDDLMYKHWDEWTESAPQPFLCHIEGEKVVTDKNLLDGTAFECPMKPFGGVEQLAFSPDGKQIAYTCRKKTGMDYALSTNSDIYLYDISTGEERNLTEEIGGYDINPAFSPDGKHLAWLSMERDGYESDQNRLMVLNMETGEKTFVSREFESSVDEFIWLNNTRLAFVGCWHALCHAYTVNLEGFVQEATNGQYDYSLCGYEEGLLYLKRHSMREPDDIYVLNMQEDEIMPSQLTHENDHILNQITMGHVVERWQPTTDGKQMLTWIILPPHFDPNKKYPTLLYCEGGPQSPVSQFWSYRWNFMMMAANDYVIVAPNRRGLPGFGNEWNEEISGDYGGQCMRDYLSAIDEAVANLPYVDKDHLGAVGASFGGFSVYWLAGHHQKRFKAFIAHDGIFNMEMQYLETEEKWFANWDMGGAYWEKDNKTAQGTFANSPHRFVDQWDTPILCIHGEKDYRILANQAMAAFDAAKLRGVPAELLIFPDENHWVLRPQNGILWQRTFYKWLDKWLK